MQAASANACIPVPGGVATAYSTFFFVFTRIEVNLARVELLLASTTLI
jgi:hypothetical protein